MNERMRTIQGNDRVDRAETPPRVERAYIQVIGLRDALDRERAILEN